MNKSLNPPSSQTHIQEENNLHFLLAYTYIYCIYCFGGCPSNSEQKLIRVYCLCVLNAETINIPRQGIGWCHGMFCQFFFSSYCGFLENGSFSEHSCNDHYLSIQEYTRQLRELFRIHKVFIAKAQEIKRLSG